MKKHLPISGIATLFVAALLFTFLVKAEDNSRKPIAGDANPDSGKNSVVIGTGTDSSMSVPLAPWWGFSFTQTLYLQNEINIGGKRIWRIGYQYVGTTPNPDFIVEVWMAHTSLSELTASVPLSSATKVYDGNYVVTIGEPYSYIEVEPFFYNNTDNLLITIIEKKPGWTSPEDKFLSTPALSPPALCLGARNDQTPYDPNNLPAGSLLEERPNIILDLEDVPVNPEIKTIPDSLYFGEVEATLTSVMTVKVINIGGGNLEITGAEITDDHYTLLNATFPVNLGPGESEWIDIQFLPTDPGLVEATLTFQADQSVPGGRTCQLSGRGLRFGVLREGFEGELFPPLGWKVYDINNDGDGWYRNVTDAPTGQTVPHTGIAAAGLDTYAGSPGQIGYNDWLITPKMVWQDGDVFKFFIKRLANQNGQTWRICLSTTGDQVSNFTPFDVITDPPITWSEKSYDLSSLGLTNGSMFYIGFQFNSLWCWPGVIDDVLGSVKVTVEKDLMAISFTGNDIFYENSVNNFTAVVGNSGLMNVAAGAYQVKACALVNGQEMVYGSVTGTAIGSGENATFTIPVTIPETGVYNLYSRVVYGEDMNPQNNTSTPLEVEVIGNSVVVKNIGTYPPTQQTPYYYLYPINFDDYRGASLHECLYYPAELNTGGIITRLSYYTAMGTYMPSRKIKVWMTQTDKQTFDSGAIPASEMTLVFDGQVNFIQGIRRANINLTQPFVYTGSNSLAVMVYYYEGGDPFIVDNALFAYEYIESGPLRNGYDNWYTTIDPNNLTHMAYVASYPVTSLMFETGSGLGHLSGKVLYQHNYQGVEDAKVEIEHPDFPGAAAVIFTNFEGIYVSPYTMAGNNLKITFSKYGYIDVTQNIALTPGNTIVLPDVFLLPRPMVSLTGSVLKSDTQTPADCALVKLAGIDSYETTTNAAGEFSFGEIWGLTSYEMTISLAGYQTYFAVVQVGDIPLTLDPVTILENAPPPHLLTATETGGYAQLNWYGAGVPFPKIFRYDDGQLAGNLITTGAPNILIGSAWRYNSIVNAVTWFTSQSGGYPPSPQVMVTVLGLNADGSPNPANVLFVQGNVQNSLGWNTFNLPSPVYAPNGFFFGISGYSNYTVVGYDDGVGEPWIWQPMTQWSNGMGAYYPLENVTAPPLHGNIFIRAAGLIYEESIPREFTDSQAYMVNTDSKTITFICEPVEPSKTAEPDIPEMAFMIPDGRAFQHYNIYRRPAGVADWEQINTNPVSDTTYIDTEWANLGAGFYQFAVEAEYTNGVKSAMAESNLLEKLPVSIADQPASQLSIFPNPSSGQFTIQSPSPILKIKVLDHTGKQVAVHAPDARNFILNLTGQPKGVFILRIETLAGSEIRKVVVLD